MVGEMAPVRSDSSSTSAMRNEPVTLTRIVPRGNWGPKARAIPLEIRKRAPVPSAPPRQTSKNRPTVLLARRPGLGRKRRGYPRGGQGATASAARKATYSPSPTTRIRSSAGTTTP